MQILTIGGVEDFSRYLGINWTFSLICCMICIFSTAGYTTISRQVVGSKVRLPCNESVGMFRQLTWKMNGENLYTFKRQKPLHRYDKVVGLNINMSVSESDQYALVMEQVQKSHAGNYTCEATIPHGVWERTWELIVTDPEEAENKLLVIVAAAVPCVCFLVFIVSLTCLKTLCKKRPEDAIQSPAVEMEQPETIYENCLETVMSQQHRNNQHFHSKPRAH